MKNEKFIVIFTILFNNCIIGYSIATRQFRKSTLLSWNGNVELGYCVEECDKEGATLSLLIDVPDEDEDEDPLVIEFPVREGNNGSLASNLWTSAFATSIMLRSPEFRTWAVGKDIAELGSGLGLAGLVAAEKSSSCLLTDYDDECLDYLRATSKLNEEILHATLETKKMDWRDDHNDEQQVDLVLGSDIAYYFYLLRPLMDTSRAFMGEGSNLFVVGQANRVSQWDFYKNIKDGCYNQVTDEREPPWPGSTKMLLFNLQISPFFEDLDNDESFSSIDRVVPISVIVNDSATDNFCPFQKFAHEATEEDSKGIERTF